MWQEYAALTWALTGPPLGRHLGWAMFGHRSQPVWLGQRLWDSAWSFLQIARACTNTGISTYLSTSFFNGQKTAEWRIIDHNRLDRTGDRALSIIPQRFYGQELGQLGGAGGLIVSGSPATLRMLGASAWDAFMDIMDQAASWVWQSTIIADYTVN